MPKNPFADWTPERVAEHTARIRGGVPQGPGPSAAPPVPKGPVKAKKKRNIDDLGLNRTERLLLDEILIPTFHEVGIQRITLKIADSCRYTADFDTVDEDGNLILWDAKGGKIWEDSIIKMKVVAATYPWIRVIMAQKKAKAKEWIFHEYKDETTIIHQGILT